MWNCPNCNQPLDDQFEACWNCGATKSGERDEDFEPVEEVPARIARDLTCLRCNQELAFLGEKSFHEGLNWGALGELGELFTARQNLDVYACLACGHVELFLPGVPAEPEE